jgi:hypothetical protein
MYTSNRSRLSVSAALCALLLVTLAACGPVIAPPPPAEGAPGPTLAQLQGGWWRRCDDQAVEFLIDGSTYAGDFAGQHRLTLTGGRLVFEDGLPDGHAVELPQSPRAFRVVDVAPGRLVLRQEPAEAGAGDWHLQACDAPAASPTP